MEEMTKHGQIGLAAMRSGMDRKTARRYLSSVKLPSESMSQRSWRTRPDPFDKDWPTIEKMLTDLPTLQAKTLFEHLQRERPGRYQDGQLRTLQRRIKNWRAKSGPPKEVFFPQEHRPGEAMQTDFTCCNKLGITIGGDSFPHLLCHSVLPFSNWESATACASESMPALKRGLQTALFRLGRVPRNHQTDHSTAATHRDLGSSKKRNFNEEYLIFLKHFAMTPRTTGVGRKEQNGDVESLHRALKNRLEQRLLLRGSRDFESTEEYESWVWEECKLANRGRNERVAKELDEMRPLPEKRVAEYTEIEAVVNSASTIRVRRNTYSVPSRLIGEKVKVRLFDTKLEVLYGGTRELSVERLRGEAKHCINYRHMIASLVRKPGAFERYRYREDLFPSLVFRRAYDLLKEQLSDRSADIQYLRLLHLAAYNTESEVASALALCAAEKELPRIEAVKAHMKVDAPKTPAMAEISVDLSTFDQLLQFVEERIG